MLGSYIDNPAYIISPAPPVPYSQGQRFTVRSHNPPLPPPKKDGACQLSKQAKVERLELSPLNRCLLHPPATGSPGTSTVEFEISRPLKAGNDHKAQVVVVNILRVDSEALNGVTTAVAKFYDPLYFDHSDDGEDPFICVNYFYPYEVASYNRLSDLQGTVIPTFYGSYSLELPVPESSSSSKIATRSVRLILVELIHGSSMQDLNPQDFSQEERKRIVRDIIDGESAVFTRNIFLEDLHPRNVVVELCSSNGSQSNIRRVVHIDFESTRQTRYIWAAEDPAGEERQLPGTYISPLLRWHKVWRKFNIFADWIDWDYEPWLEAEYAHTVDSITPHMRVEFLPKFLNGKGSAGK
jgi:hypothetical protein